MNQPRPFTHRSPVYKVALFVWYTALIVMGFALGAAVSSLLADPAGAQAYQPLEVRVRVTPIVQVRVDPPPPVVVLAVPPVEPCPTAPGVRAYPPPLVNGASLWQPRSIPPPVMHSHPEPGWKTPARRVEEARQRWYNRPRPLAPVFTPRPVFIPPQPPWSRNPR